MIRKMTLTALAVAAVTATTIADARPGGPPDIAAIEARMNERFNAIDADGSGDISPSEFMAHEGHGGPRGHHGGLRGQFGPPGAPDDVDVEAAEARAFSLVDSNGDGMVSADEFTMEALSSARRTAMKEQAFARLDTNGDGVLSRSEMPNPTDRMRAADTDGDGKLSREERRAARGEWRGRG